MPVRSTQPIFFVNPLAGGAAGYNQRGPVIVNGNGVTPYGVVRGGTFYPNPIAPNPSYIIPTPSRGTLNTYQNPVQTPVQYIQTQAFKNLPLPQQQSYLQANGLSQKRSSYTISSSTDFATEGTQIKFMINRSGGNLNQSETLLLQPTSQDYVTSLNTGAGRVLSTRGARNGQDFQLNEKFITFAPGEASKTILVDTLINPAFGEFARFGLSLSRADANWNYQPEASSGQVVLLDTILKTYMLTGASSYNEGSGLSFILLTTSVSDGTVLYWKIDGGSIASDDLKGGSLSGSLSIKGNTGSINEQIIADFKSEGIETGSISVYTDSNFTNPAGNVLQFSINDTSTPTLRSKEQTTYLPGGYTDLIIDYAGASNGYGNQSSNRITGNSFSNNLYAGAGRDILTGGAGRDNFFIAGPIECVSSVADVISDFNSVEGDLLYVSRSAVGYTRTSGFERVFTASDDASLSTALATSNSFIYDQRTGELYFNQNGALAGAGGGGVFAILENRSAIGSISLTA